MISMIVSTTWFSGMSALFGHINDMNLTSNHVALGITSLITCFSRKDSRYSAQITVATNLRQFSISVS